MTRAELLHERQTKTPGHCPGASQNSYVRIVLIGVILEFGLRPLSLIEKSFGVYR